jgi:hypothetical protein
VYEGTVRDAYERWLTDPCRRCIPEYHEDEDADNNTKTEIKDSDYEEVLWDLIWWFLE